MTKPILPEFIQGTAQEVSSAVAQLIGQDFSGDPSYRIVRTVGTTHVPGPFGVDKDEAVLWQVECECEKKKEKR